MITPEQLKDKVCKSFFKLVTAQLKGEDLFPWVVPSNKAITGSNYSDWKNDLLPLYQQSKAVKQKGYSVDWKEKKINGSKQNIPSRIYFESFADVLYFTHKERDFQSITSSYQLLTDHFPKLTGWANDNPQLLLEYHGKWGDLLKVCIYFASHTPPHTLYLRELPIEVHSKFIEQHTIILKKLLDMILPPLDINGGETNFETRYGIRQVQVYTQIRILDEKLKSTLGYDECRLTLEDAAWLDWVPEKVFIIENQVCFLTFPKVENAVAIFGEGFKSRTSRHIPWLAKTKLFCWFDLDSAGFEMVNMIRQHYPDANSFLMDRSTFDAFENYSVENKARPKQLPLLDSREALLYQYLSQNHLRLEQERIQQSYVIARLAEYTVKNS